MTECVCWPLRDLTCSQILVAPPVLLLLCVKVIFKPLTHSSPKAPTARTIITSFMPQLGGAGTSLHAGDTL